MVVGKEEGSEDMRNGGSEMVNSTEVESADGKLKPARSGLPLCPLVPSWLVGPIKVWFDDVSFADIVKKYPYVEPGGHSKPVDCIARHRVAVVIPYRNRIKQLRIFLNNLHSLLHKQQLDYAIVVVEQMANQTFNRAKLMNVGFVEALKRYDFQCVIFHDVDLLPEDDRNLYNCPEQPRHMSVAVDKFKYRLPYKSIFGGITALTATQFRKLNGYSNQFWGWGGEDDEMSSRVSAEKFRISRYPANIARYKMIRHDHETSNPVNECRFNLMYKFRRRYKQDGLSSLNYRLLDSKLEPLYIWVLVDLLEVESRKALASEHICKH
jgi:beta-1,4-galactosyltransferase 3